MGRSKMKLAPYTEGPWSLFATSKTLQVSAGGGEHTSTDAIVFWTGFDACARPPAEKYANARLIAAAPDLHKALLRCLLVLSGEAHSKSELVRAMEDGVAACRKATEPLSEAF